MGILAGLRARSTTNITLSGNTISSCVDAVEAKDSTFTLTPIESFNTLTSGAIAGFECPAPPAEEEAPPAE